jgi:hypothetical protein
MDRAAVRHRPAQDPRAVGYSFPEGGRQRDTSRPGGSMLVARVQPETLCGPSGWASSPGRAFTRRAGASRALENEEETDDRQELVREARWRFCDRSGG